MHPDVIGWGILFLWYWSVQSETAKSGPEVDTSRTVTWMPSSFSLSFVGGMRMSSGNRSLSQTGMENCLKHCGCNRGRQWCVARLVTRELPSPAFATSSRRPWIFCCLLVLALFSSRVFSSAMPEVNITMVSREWVGVHSRLDGRLLVCLCGE